MPLWRWYTEFPKNLILISLRRYAGVLDFRVYIRMADYESKFGAFLKACDNLIRTSDKRFISAGSCPRYCQLSEALNKKVHTQK